MHQTRSPQFLIWAALIVAVLAMTQLTQGAPAVFAQATRTFVSGVGDDLNPCSRTSPCKTFAGAISKTAAGGEISVLDPGGYGAVTITKSITLNGEGTLGSILASLTNGVIVNAAATDTVTLRNISINGAGGSGLSGVSFLAGEALHLDNVMIFEFNTAGVRFAPTGTSELFISNSSIRNNAVGVLTQPGTSGLARVALDGVELENNGMGVRAEDRSKIVVRDSNVVGSASHAFLANSTSPAVEVTIENTTAAHSGLAGLRAAGSGAVIRFAGMNIYNNQDGISASGGASAISFGGNKIVGNVVNGAPTSTVAPQ